MAYIYFLFHLSQPHNLHLLSQGEPLSAAPLGSHLLLLGLKPEAYSNIYPSAFPVLGNTALHSETRGQHMVVSIFATEKPSALAVDGPLCWIMEPFPSGLTI